MIRKILIVSMVILLALACQDEQTIKPKVHADIVIKTGVICGWCSKNDTLSISDNSVRYVNYTQCNNINPAVEKTAELSDSELNSLLSSLDFNEFKKINLNTCNVCVDGCDTWISINKGSESHMIRFTGNESELQPVRTFMDQLNALKTNYQ